MRDITPEDFNRLGAGTLPAVLGMVVTSVAPSELRAELVIRPELHTHDGYLNAASIVALADTACRYACVAHLPDGALGYSTVEVKSNQLGSALEGTVDCLVRAGHLGRTTQHWDAVVRHRETGRPLALFRSTLTIHHPKGAKT